MKNTLFSIMQDSFAIKRVLYSCTTEEQLNNCTNWVNDIFVNWDKKLEASSYNKSSVDFIIHTIIPEIGNVVNEVHNEIKTANKKPKPEEIEVHGFE